MACSVVLLDVEIIEGSQRTVEMGRVFELQERRMSETVDVAIVGGGVMGASVAYWLTKYDPTLSIIVIERDPGHTYSSTALSVASIRQQFSIPLNVRISRYGTEFIRTFAERTASVGAIDLGFKGNGYLFLAGSDAGATVLRENCALQQAEGAATEILKREDVSRRFPWLDAQGVALASFGGDAEGWFDNMGLLTGLRNMARAGGARFVQGEVEQLVRCGDRVQTVTLADGRHVSAGAIVNAAGPRSAQLLLSLDDKLPVEPRKRTVFVVDSPGARHPNAPLVVDAQGFYARPEGDHWITALMPEDDRAVDPEDFDPSHWEFEETLWPMLFARIPGFEAAKVLRYWVGHYAFNTFDQNAIVGRHPRFENLFLVNGFSGHGLQQAPAMGRGLAELIVFGGYQSLDLSEFSYDRIAEGRQVREKAIV